MIPEKYRKYIKNLDESEDTIEWILTVFLLLSDYWDFDCDGCPLDNLCPPEDKQYYCYTVPKRAMEYLGG